MLNSHNFSNYHKNYAAINLGAITHNLNALKSCMGKGVMAMAVVKANAYGHGSVFVSKHIENEVDFFAVADFDEALELRNSGIKKPILILSYTSPLIYDELIENDVTATIYNYEEAKQLSSIAKSKGKKAKIHIAVDTGMGRIGFFPDSEGADEVEKISQLEGLILEGLFSHYACADSLDKTSSLEQTELFDKFITLLEEKGVNIPIKHICNSAGTIELQKKYNMCRLGISLYGLYPSDEVDKNKIKLIPAMEVISHVVHIKEIPSGFKIGYGHTYTSSSPRRIATVCIGYADGYNRCFSNVGYVLINGKKAPVVGRVCMDQIMVDITDIENVSVGIQATILGENNGARITAQELGEMSHSFNYEVICTFMPRVKRIYFNDNKERQ